MRMLVKYTAYVDFDEKGSEVDRSYYLSFVNRDDVMDIPFPSMEALKERAGRYTIGEYIRTAEFQEAVSVYDDYRDFFRDVDVLVLYDNAVAVDFHELTT